MEYKRWINEELTGGELSEEEAAALALREKIQWLVLAKAWPGKPPLGSSPVYENQDVAIYRLRETGTTS